MAGALVRRAADQAGVQLRPVDSEHSALWQCLQGEPPEAVSTLILTASGGPFREWSREQLDTATPAQALRHPVWAMGNKITIDSATLMNKGLEVIEAHWLFAAPPERIEVVVHPQSIVHSLVDYDDGSVLAQLGNPDMRTAIGHALAWPERIDTAVAPLDEGDDARAFKNCLVTVAAQAGDVQQHILRAVVGHDEAETLGDIEPLHDTGNFGQVHGIARKVLDIDYRFR